MLSFLLTVCVLLIVVWAVNQLAVPAPFHTILMAALAIILLLAVFGLFGVGPGIGLR